MMSWFTDDHRRFDTSSRASAPLFHWSSRQIQPQFKSRLAMAFVHWRAKDSYLLNTPSQMIGIADVLFRVRRPQIIACSLEITGGRGFLFTSEVVSLSDCFELGKDIVCFSKIVDLVQKIRHYPAHDTKRKRIRLICQRGSLNDHTNERRFCSIF